MDNLFPTPHGDCIVNAKLCHSPAPRHHQCMCGYKNNRWRGFFQTSLSCGQILSIVCSTNPYQALWMTNKWTKVQKIEDLLKEQFTQQYRTLCKQLVSRGKTMNRQKSFLSWRAQVWWGRYMYQWVKTMTCWLLWWKLYMTMWGDRE